jgi:ABC-type nitrate/sulfonate/bicarbonate transport system permease component
MATVKGAVGVRLSGRGIQGIARKRLPGLMGIAVVIGIWWLLAVTVLSAGGAVPTPADVVAQLASDGWSFYQTHVSATVETAMRGYLWGNILAIAVAIAVILLPALELAAMQVAIASYCLPIMAVGPILVVTFDGRTPMVALAGLSVFFTTLVSALLGLRSSPESALDVVRAAGGGRLQQLWRVQSMASLPGIVSGLKLAVPAALLGTIVGEFLGTAQTGLGVAMVIAQQQLEVSRTWGIALVSGAVAGIGYFALDILGRKAFPWARVVNR